MASIKTVYIRDTIWIIKLLSSKKYKALNGPDSIAVTLADKKEIHFIKSEFTLKTIIHELLHAYFSTLYLESASLTNIQFEEIVCEFLEDYIDVIYKQALMINKTRV